MPEDEVGQEGGIKGALTRPIGPFPVWVWALIVVGAFFLYKILKGGSSDSGNTGTALGFGGYAPAGTDSTGGGGAAATDLTPLLDKITAQGEQLTEQSGNLAIFQQLSLLQSQLSTTINQRETALYEIERLTLAINTSRDYQRQCTTSACKAKYTTAINNYIAQRQPYLDKLNTYNTTIANLQNQIAQAQATVSITPPSTTSTNQQTPLLVTPTTTQSQPTVTVA